jgi:hypothetical protein
MARTLSHSRNRNRTETRDSEIGAGEAPVVYERQVGTALLGLTAVVVGAWGLICGYVGPYFGFRPLNFNPWIGSLQEGLLHAAPGAAAVVAGLILIAMGPARRAVGRFGLVLPAVLLLAAGAWFVIGPTAWPTIERGRVFLAASPLRNLLNVACSAYAPGLILVMLGGMALKASIVPPVAYQDPMTPAEADRRPLEEDRDRTSAMPVADRTSAMPVADRTSAMPVADRGPAEAGDGPTAARTGV